MLFLKTWQRLSPKQKCMVLIAITIMIVAIITFFVSKSNSVVGTYDYYRLEISGERIGLGSDDGYLEINGTDNDKISMLYFEIGGSTARIKGPVFKIREQDDYIVYKFYVDSLSGTAIEKSDYIYLNYYPKRGDHGIIEIRSSDDVTMFFKKVK